jgi:hypothetical protein
MPPRKKSKETLVEPGPDDGFSAADEPDPATRKRTVKKTEKTGPRKKPARKPRKPNPDPEQARGDLSAGTPLGPVRLLASPATTNLNAWLAVRDELVVQKPIVHTPVTHQPLISLRDLPDVPGRDFKFEVKSELLEVNWDPIDESDELLAPKRTGECRALMDKYRKTIKTWRVTVFDGALPKTEQKRLRLFPEYEQEETNIWRNGKLSAKPTTPENEKYIQRGGPLDDTICPSPADVDKVGAEACRLLNKYPDAIPDSEFPHEVGHGRYPMRSTLELMSLQAIREDFDFRRIRYVFRCASSLHYHAYYPLGIKPSTRNFGYHVPVPSFPIGYSRQPSIPISRSVFESYTKPPAPPLWWAIRALPPVYTARPVNTSVDVAVPDDLVTHTAENNADAGSILPLSKGPKTTKEVRIQGCPSVPQSTILEVIDYICWKMFGLVGSELAFKEAQVTVLRHIHSNLPAHPSVIGPYSGRKFFKADTTTRFAIIQAIQQSISGFIPPLTVGSSRSSRTVVALAAESAYRVFVRTSQILLCLQEFYVSVDELLHSKKSLLSKELYCQCVDHVQKQKTVHYCMWCLEQVPCYTMIRHTDDRLICASHLVVVAKQENSSPPPPGPEARLRKTCLKREGGTIYGSLSFQHRSAVADAVIAQLTPKGYKDIFNGDRLTPEGHDPRRHTLDATFPLWFANDEAFVHHKDNVGLTSHFLNAAKQDDIPIVLAIASDAVKTDRTDNAKISQLELAFDHCFRIRCVLPRSIKLRRELASMLGKEWWDGFYRMMKTGVYDGMNPVHNFKVDFGTREGSSWDFDSITRLKRICLEIEHSPDCNPQGLQLPRGQASRNSAPWLWNEAHMFDNLDWDYLGRLFSERFRRLDRHCDLANDHRNECSETLFLTCVILWFRYGGKDEILGLHMTVFSRHALRFSIGRALHVEPGSIMRTGWTVKYPSSLSQYNDALRTITMESWFMNRAKSNFPCTPENIVLFTDLLRDINMDSPFWEGHPAQYTDTQLQFPKIWQGRGSALGATDITDKPLDDMEEEDDEALVMGTVPVGQDEEDNEGLEEIIAGDEEGEEEDMEKMSRGGEQASTVNDSQLPGTTGVDREDERSANNAAANFLFDCQSHIPEHMRVRFNQAILILQEAAMRSIVNTASTAPTSSTAASRINLFEQFKVTIVDWFQYKSESSVTVEELVDTTLEEWQGLNSSIQIAFGRQDIVSFCQELDGKDGFRYAPY